MNKMEYTYSWLQSGESSLSQNPEFINKMVHLYENHYGKWSSKFPNNPGGKIRFSETRMRELLKSDDSKIAIAMQGEELIGYAIAIQTKYSGYGVISWITQFVIHENHRNKGVGKNILFSIWGFSDHFSWGLVTANPYAVRALEKATRRRCESSRIAKNCRKLLAIGTEHVPYIKPEIEYSINKSESKVNTSFFVDHSELQIMLNRVVSDSKPWLLGAIPEGWEWFAFTFNDQSQIDLTADEIDSMLKVSDEVVKKAYSRMLLDSTTQRWAKNTMGEAKFIAHICSLTSGNSILDFGCGIGRHAIALAEMTYDVNGVDYIPDFIDRANKDSKKRNLNAVFTVGDCRNISMNRTYDLIICLYDVIGTYIDNSQNIEVLHNIYRHLKPGGKAVISVMNYDLTERLAKNKFSILSEPNKLLELPASQIMERTGDIFNPDYYIIDPDTQVTYRKEQFSSGSSLPVELIVRDRRFRKDEIERLCKDAGLIVIWSRFVRSGHWDLALNHDDNHAKEILLFCKKAI